MAYSNESPIPGPQGQGEAPLDEKETRKQTLSTWAVVGVVVAIIGLRFPDTTAGHIVSFMAKFVLVLGILVFVHEWGHYQFARWAGMKVNRFALGFPPWIYTHRHNGIDYSIGALPIGGMVDIAGLGSEEEMVATAKGEETAPLMKREKPPRGTREFQETGLGWRFWTLFAGPLMNFIYALVIAIGLYSVVGIPDKVTVTNKVEMVQAGMPADKAGLQNDDVIVGVNGVKIKDHAKLVETIRQFRGKTLPLTIERGGKILEKQIQPIYDDDSPTMDGKGTERAAVVGIGFVMNIDSYEKLSVPEAVKVGFLGATSNVRMLISLIGRAATGQMSSYEKRGVTGPVGIAQAVEISSKRGLYSFLEFTAALSLNLALMNLLPIPALDGGRILFLGYELVARRPIDSRKESFVHMVGMVMVLAFMLFITLRDVLPYIAKGLHGLTQG